MCNTEIHVVNGMLETMKSRILAKKALLFGLLSLFGLAIGIATNIIIETLLL